MVVSELRGEKIDIIPYNDEPARFVAKALSPARVREVLVDDDARQATVIVPDDQLSLAIGREGQNARLAARLTGWRIDIKSETDFAQSSGEETFEQEQESGRCAAVLSNGRRCPNATIPASRFCGLGPHQALAKFNTNSVVVLTKLTEEEIEFLNNPAALPEDVEEIVTRVEAEVAEDEAAGAAAEAAEAGEEPFDPDAVEAEAAEGTGEVEATADEATAEEASAEEAGADVTGTEVEAGAEEAEAETKAEDAIVEEDSPAPDAAAEVADTESAPEQEPAS
jgi:N utilization substance protein A